MDASRWIRMSSLSCLLSSTMTQMRLQQFWQSPDSILSVDSLQLVPPVLPQRPLRDCSWRQQQMKGLMAVPVSVAKSCISPQQPSPVIIFYQCHKRTLTSFSYIKIIISNYSHSSEGGGKAWRRDP